MCSWWQFNNWEFLRKAEKASIFVFPIQWFVLGIPTPTYGLTSNRSQLTRKKAVDKCQILLFFLTTPFFLFKVTSKNNLGSTKPIRRKWMNAHAKPMKCWWRWRCWNRRPKHTKTFRAWLSNAQKKCITMIIPVKRWARWIHVNKMQYCMT